MKKSFKELLKSKGYTITEFAKASDVGVDLVWRIAAGYYTFDRTSLLSAYKMAQVLEMSLEELATNY